MANLNFIILFLSIIVTTFNRGFLSFAGILIAVSVLFLLFIVYFYRNKINKDESNSETLALYSLIVSYSLFMFFSGGIYQTDFISSAILQFLPLFIFPVILSYLVPQNNIQAKDRRLRYIFLLLAALAFRILIIIASPSPTIDVFTILKEAPMKVISGINPYNTHYSQVYAGVPSNYFAYWPVSFLLQVPFVALFGDPRLLFAILETGSALLIYLIGGRNIVSESLSLIYLFRPNSLFIVEQSWLVEMEFFFLVLTFFILSQKFSSRRIDKMIFGGLIFGLLVGIKPVYAVLYPFLFPLFKQVKKFFFASVAIILITVSPFFIADPKVFFIQTIGGFFYSNKQNWWIPYPRAMSLNALYNVFYNRDIPFFVTIIVVLAVLVFLVKNLYTAIVGYKKNDETLSVVLLSVAIFYSVFYILFRYTFINESYFVTDMIILWMASIAGNKKLVSM